MNPVSPMMQPIHYDNREAFAAACEDLSHYGEKGHEVIKITKTEAGFVPIAAEKDWWFVRLFNYILKKSPSDEKIAAFVADFLDANKEFLADQVGTLRGSLFKIAHGNKLVEKKFNHLLDDSLVKQGAAQKTDAERGKILLGAEEFKNKVINLTEEAFDKKKLAYEQTENQAKENYEQRLQALKDLEKQIIEKTERLEQLQKHEEDLRDTVLICADGKKIPTHFRILEELEFFKIYFGSNMEGQEFLTNEEKTKFKHGFDFSAFSSDTVKNLLKYVEATTSVQDIGDKNALLDLYRLASYLNDETLKERCLAAFSPKLTSEDRLTLLTSMPLPTNDPLMKDVTKWATEHFDSFSDKPVFLKISTPFLIQILKSDHLMGKTEEDLFKDVMKWVNAQASERGVSPKEVLYEEVGGERLIDHIRFEHISGKTFATQVLQSELLDSAEVKKWSNYFLNPEGHEKRPIRPMHVDFYTNELEQAECNWRIPAHDVLELKRGSQISTDNFKINNNEISFVIQNREKGGFQIYAVINNANSTFNVKMEIEDLSFDSTNPKGRTTLVGNSPNKFANGGAFSTEEITKNTNLDRNYLQVKFVVTPKTLAVT